jgi:hypothetical protein
MNSQRRADAEQQTYPDARGRYGAFGGRYVPETLVPALDRLQAGIAQHLHSAQFQAQFNHELKTWVGRPTALSHAPSLSKRWQADVWLKREDLAHTGAHKINNCVGQTLLAKRIGPSASSPKPAPASMASRAPRRPRVSACLVWSTWARSTSSGRRPTSDA